MSHITKHTRLQYSGTGHLPRNTESEFDTRLSPLRQMEWSGSPAGVRQMHTSCLIICAETSRAYNTFLGRSKQETSIIINLLGSFPELTQNDNMSVAPNAVDETMMNDTIDPPKTRQVPTTVSIASALRKNVYRLHFSCDHTGRYRPHTKRKIQW